MPQDHENAAYCLTAMSNNAGAVGGGAIYGLGIFGALVYYWQQADVFWEYLLSIVQGFFWPAWMVYEIFQDPRGLNPQNPQGTTSTRSVVGGDRPGGVFAVR